MTLQMSSMPPVAFTGLVPFPAPGGGQFRDLEVPAVFFPDRYYALRRAIPVTATGWSLMAFGVDMQTNLIALETSTGAIWSFQAGHVDRISFVNSTLAKFNECAEAAAAIYLALAPKTPVDIGDFDEAGNAVRVAITAIDAPAVESDTFWDTFYWDVLAGDFSDVAF